MNPNLNAINFSDEFQLSLFFNSIFVWFNFFLPSRQSPELLKSANWSFNLRFNLFYWVLIKDARSLHWHSQLFSLFFASEPCCNIYLFIYVFCFREFTLFREDSSKFRRPGGPGFLRENTKASLNFTQRIDWLLAINFFTLWSNFNPLYVR